MPLYESVFIARQDISAAQVDTLADSFENVISENGGSIAKRENWGLRTMAYKLKKNRKGHYVLFNIDAPATAVHEMERQMRINEDILRYLTVRVDELEEGPSIIMRNKDRGDDRPRGRGRPDRESREPREPREAAPSAEAKADAGGDAGAKEGRPDRESREPREPREAAPSAEAKADAGGDAGAKEGDGMNGE